MDKSDLAKTLTDSSNSKDKGASGIPGSGTGMDRKVKKKTWTVKRIGGMAAVLFFLIAIIYGVLSTAGGSRLNVQAEKITIAQVSRGAFQEYIPVIGTLEPIKTVYLDAVEGGRVDQIFVDEGSMLEQGDQILKLTNNNLQLQMLNNEARMYETMYYLRQARLSMEQNSLNLQQQMAEIDYRLGELQRKHVRYQQLHEKGLISQQEYKQVRDEYRYMERRRDLTLRTFQQDSLLRQANIGQLEAQVDHMQQNLEVVRQNLDNLMVRAPIDGQLTSLNAEIGESISPGQRLGQVDEIDEFKVIIPIDEHYLSRVSIGQEGTFTFAGSTYKVQTTKVYPEVQNGRFRVDMEFTGETPGGLRRGQTLHINLELAAPSMAMLVPRGGFFQTTGGNWIYVVSEGGDAATRRSIRLGRQNPQYFEVLEGLEPGERVVTSSYDNFGEVDVLVLK